MTRILVTDGIDEGAAFALKNKGYEIVEQYFSPVELKEEVKDFDAIIVRSATKVTKDIIDASQKTKRLRQIVRGGVGVDNIDVQYAIKKGIAVDNTPKASSLSVAELAIGHMFALARNIYISNVSMRNGLWEKKKYKGVELAGKTLGLIGFGRIAKETARLAEALGMDVIYNTRSGEKDGYNQYEFVLMEELFKRSDIISLHIPCDKSKGPVIGEKEFEWMKKGAFLINCARGELVDGDALLAALDSGKVAAAALDVFENEPPKNKRLYTHDRVSLTPHIGGSTIEAQKKIGQEIVEIILSKFAK